MGEQHKNGEFYDSPQRVLGRSSKHRLCSFLLRLDVAVGKITRRWSWKDLTFWEDEKMCRTRRARVTAKLSQLAPHISGRPAENDNGVNATPYEVVYCRVNTDADKEKPKREEAAATNG